MAKGTLPRYVVNFEEILSAFISKPDGMFDADAVTLQRCKGFYIKTNTDKVTYTQSWSIKSDIALTGVKIAHSSDIEYFMDNFDIKILHKEKELEVFSNVYVKDIQEYKNMTCFLKIKKGSKIIITYRNDSKTAKDVWFDLDYIGEKETTDVKIICIDKDTGNVLYTEFRERFSEGNHLFIAPKIDGYCIEPYFQRADISGGGVQEVIFEYLSIK